MRENGREQNRAREGEDRRDRQVWTQRERACGRVGRKRRVRRREKEGGKKKLDHIARVVHNFRLLLMY